MEHPVADYAKAVMQVAAAGTGVFVSDGSTNILPVGDDAAVRRGWSLHADSSVGRLERGYYQGWDLHPAQLPTRYAATYAFYREGLPEAVTRLRAYLGQQDSQVPRRAGHRRRPRGIRAAGTRVRRHHGSRARLGDRRRDHPSRPARPPTSADPIASSTAARPSQYETNGGLK